MISMLLIQRIKWSNSLYLQALKANVLKQAVHISRQQNCCTPRNFSEGVSGVNIKRLHFIIKQAISNTTRCLKTAVYIVTFYVLILCTFILIWIILVILYEAYSESKYSFTVKKKSSKVSYKMLLLSDSTFFKLFFHIFAAIIEALIIVGHKFLYALLIECGRLWC